AVRRVPAVGVLDVVGRLGAQEAVVGGVAGGGGVVRGVALVVGHGRAAVQRHPAVVVEVGVRGGRVAGHLEHPGVGAGVVHDGPVEVVLLEVREQGEEERVALAAVVVGQVGQAAAVAGSEEVGRQADLVQVVAAAEAVGRLPHHLHGGDEQADEDGDDGDDDQQLEEGEGGAARDGRVHGGTRGLGDGRSPLTVPHAGASCTRILAAAPGTGKGRCVRGRGGRAAKRAGPSPPPLPIPPATALARDA